MPTETLRRPSSWWLRALLVFAGAAAIWIGLSALSTAIFGSVYTFASHIMRASGTFVLVLALLIGMLRGERVSAASYGLLPGRRTPGDLGMGALGYLLPFTVAAAVILGIAAATISVPGSVVEVLGQFAAALVLILLYEAIPEELIFRGYLFTALRRHLPRWATVIAQSALFCPFGVLIGAAQTPDRLLLFLLFSLSLGVIRAVTGSVFAAIGFHAAFQLVTQPVLGTQWTAVSLDDPERWFQDIAYGLVPLILGPVVVVVLARLRRRTVSSPTP